jgi:glycerophosphoryl diester phosphodiesterase
VVQQQDMTGCGQGEFVSHAQATAFALWQVDVVLSPAVLYALQVAAVYHGMLNETLMDVLRGGNKSVYAWTANRADELQPLLDLAVDGIVTNNPELLLQAVQARLANCQQ